MVTIALLVCFPILESNFGHLFLGHPITVSDQYTHVQILTALKLVTPSDSYICTDKPIDKNVLDKPKRERYNGGWMGWGYGTNIK